MSAINKINVNDSLVLNNTNTIKYNDNGYLESGDTFMYLHTGDFAPDFTDLEYDFTNLTYNASFKGKSGYKIINTFRLHKIRIEKYIRSISYINGQDDGYDYFIIHMLLNKTELELSYVVYMSVMRIKREDI